MSPLTQIPSIGAQTYQQNTKLDPSSSAGASCLDEIHNDTRTKTTSFDESKAIASALGYDQFKEMVKNDRVTNGHLVLIWSMSPVSCIVTPISLTIQFMATDSEDHQQVVIVGEDLNSLLPTGVTTEKTVEHTVSSTTSSNLAGYQFNAPSGTSNPYVYESALTYYVPVPGVPTKPTGFTCGTSGASQCYASVWSGISVYSGGTGELVQSGTDSVCSGTSGTACGTTSYRAWLEIYDGPGSSLNQISYCDQNPPTLSNLTEFNPPSDTISNVYGTIWYNNQNNGIQVPYNTGSGLEYYMQNGGVPNVNPGSVSSSRFTLTWNTSQNT